MSTQYLSEEIAVNNAGNFTFGSNVEVDESGSRLVDLKIPGAGIFCPFTLGSNGIYGEGSLSGSLRNGASVSDGVLNCVGGTASLDILSAFKLTTNGIMCIRMVVIPQESGTPSADRMLFCVCKDGSGSRTFVTLEHDSATGHILLSIRLDDSSYLAQDYSLGAWSPTSGNPYTFEFNMDIVNGGGVTRLYIDGLQQGASVIGTGAYDMDYTNIVRFSNNYNFMDASNTKFDDILIFPTVQHISDHSEEHPYSYSETTYSLATNLISRNATVLLCGIQSFDVTINKEGNDDVLFYQSLSEAKKWHDGESWVDSDGSADQMNTLAQVSENIADLSIPSDTYWKLVWAPISDDGSSTPEVTNIAITYEFEQVMPTIYRTIVHGIIADSNQDGVEGATIKFTPTVPFYYDGVWIAKSKSVTSDANGEYKVPIVENDSFGGTYDIEIRYEDGGQYQTESATDVLIPKQDTISQVTIFAPE